MSMWFHTSNEKDQSFYESRLSMVSGVLVKKQRHMSLNSKMNPPHPTHTSLKRWLSCLNEVGAAQKEHFAEIGEFSEAWNVTFLN